jgi:hypothetical protein
MRNMKMIPNAVALAVAITAFSAVADEGEALEDGLLMNEYECTQVWDTKNAKDEREAKRICASFSNDMRSGIESGWSTDMLNQVMEAQWVFLNNEDRKSLPPQVDKILIEMMMNARKGAPDGPMLQPKSFLTSTDGEDAQSTASTAAPQHGKKDLNDMSPEEFAAVILKGQKQLESTPDGKLYIQLMEQRKQREFENQFKPLCKPGGISANCRQY